MHAFLMGLKSVSVEQLNQTLQQSPVFIVDVNSSQSWARGHVRGAVNLESTSFNIDDLPADKDSTLVFYCSNFLCREAPLAARRAQSIGYKNVRVMSAGISGWNNANLPIICENLTTSSN